MTPLGGFYKNPYVMCASSRMVVSAVGRARSASPASQCCNIPSPTIMGWLQKPVNSSKPTSPGATHSPGLRYQIRAQRPASEEISKDGQ